MKFNGKGPRKPHLPASSTTIETGDRIQCPKGRIGIVKRVTLPNLLVEFFDGEEWVREDRVAYFPSLDVIAERAARLRELRRGEGVDHV